MPLGPRIPSAEEQASRLINNAQANAQTWLDHTLSPTVDPIDAAKKAAAKYEQNTQKAIQEKRFQKGLDRVDRDAMEETIKQTGAAGFAAGVARREQKILESRRKLVPLQTAVVNELDKMQTTTEQEAKNKMLKNFDLQKQLGEKYRSS